ncbi:MAG: S-layer homology domain-containing protein [Clostridiales bacterium]|jgi:hypothetical protein|nr:S-layer homology domain-containing protein [Clostridiales bacterium]
MKRFVKKRWGPILLTLVLALSALPLAIASTGYSDLDGHWAKENIEKLVYLGIVNASLESAGSFKPDELITRAETVEILLKANLPKALLEPMLEEAEDLDSFRDVKGHRLRNYIELAKKYEIAAGYPDGTFKADASITRAEFCALMTSTQEVLEDMAKASSATISFGDLPQSHWAAKFIIAAAKTGLVAGYPDGSFAPEGNITRAEAYTMASKYYDALFASYEGVAGFASEGGKPAQGAGVSLINLLDGKTLKTVNANEYGQFRLPITGFYDCRIEVASGSALAIYPKVRIPLETALLPGILELEKPIQANGIAFDKNGNPLKNSSLSFEIGDLNFSATTSASGAFSVALLPNRTYSAFAEIDGIKKRIGEIAAKEVSLDDISLKEPAAEASGSASESSSVQPASGYTLTVLAGAGGTVSSGVNGKYESGVGVNLEATPNQGFAFKGWKSSNGGDFGDPSNSTTIFFMPSGNATVTAEFEGAALDSDEDGLPDYFERMIGSDPLLKDSDGDGIDDGAEYRLDLDPLSKDSDGNGVPDDEEDFDGDGLTNAEEANLSTDPGKADTDSDGLNDFDEVMVYGTSPIKIDTDEDSLTDFEEVELGLDPLKPSTDGIVSDAQRLFPQTLGPENFDEGFSGGSKIIMPSISGDVSGLIGKNVFARISGNDAFDENRAAVGELLRLETDYADGFTLKLSYDLTKLIVENGLDYAKELVICKTDDEEGLAPLDTTLHGSVLSADVTEEGDYLVINANDFLRNFGIDALYGISEDEAYDRLPTDMPREFAIVETATTGEALLANEEDLSSDEADYAETTDNYRNYGAVSAARQDSLRLSNQAAPSATLTASPTAPLGAADIVFVIDSTGSMGDEIANVAENIKSFADQIANFFNVNANFALVEYKDISYEGLGSTVVHKNGTSNWRSDVEDFKVAVENLIASGGGDSDETAIDGLETARRLDWRQDSSKFIILVTDANYKGINRYGIESMDDMASLLKGDAISAFVITTDAQEASYRSLYSETGGLYSNIYGDFGFELQLIADKIGVAAGGGTWVVLDDFQVVRIESTPDNPNQDTDGDGILDYAELGNPTIASLEWAIEKVREANNILPSAVYEGRSTIEVYNYITNPTLPDTDFDGINDNDAADFIKRDKASVDGNAFSGKAVTHGYNINVEFSVDYRNFFRGNSVYQKDLSVLGSIYSAVIYEETNLNVTSGASVSGKTPEAMKGFGLSDVKVYRVADDFGDDDVSELSIGHRLVSYKGLAKEIIVVVTRGTNKTIQEWSSNFDVGADTAGYWDRANPYWRNHDNHKGFDVTANRMDDYILDYINSYANSGAPKTIFITGHSRGAAMANILGKLFEDRSDYESFVYALATPNTTTSPSASSYATIFNLMNTDDIITYMPLESWGFKKYGAVKSISVNENYENKWLWAEPGTWEWLFGEDYNDDGGTQRTLYYFSKLASNRNEAYAYTCKDHGSGSSEDNLQAYNSLPYLFSANAISAKNSLMDSYSDRMKRFVKVEISDKTFLGIHKYTVYSHQTPAFFMMTLADMVVSKNPFKYDVAPAYEYAKTSFVFTAIEIAHIGGMTHPHTAGTYYLIARNDFKPIY